MVDLSEEELNLVLAVLRTGTRTITLLHLARRTTQNYLWESTMDPLVLVLVLLNLGGLIYSVCTKSTSSDPNLLSQFVSRNDIMGWQSLHLSTLWYWKFLYLVRQQYLSNLVPSGTFCSTCRHNILKKKRCQRWRGIWILNLVRAVDLASAHTQFWVVRRPDVVDVDVDVELHPIVLSHR